MLLLLTLLAAQAAPDPLAPARAGNLRCVEPDAARRTCRSIVRYTVHEDGSFDAIVSGFIGNDGAVVIVYQTAGAIEGDAVCAAIRPYDVLHGRLYHGGKLLSEAEAVPIQDRIRIQLQDVAGRKRCTIDQAAGERLIANVTLNGVVQTDQARPVAWISPEDGYALGL